MSEREAAPTGIEKTLHCQVCDVTLPDLSVLESHFTGRKHQKRIRSIDLQARQEGKAVFATNLGLLKLPEILEYMSTFGVVVNLCPRKDTQTPDLLHNVIVEFESEDAVSRILSRDLYRKHRIKIPGSSPPQYQFIVIYERKFQQRKRSPTPPPCPTVSHDQVVMRLNLIFDCEEQLEELSKLLNLDMGDVQARVGICRHIEKTFGSTPHSQCVVYPFGSSINGLGFPGCDLDIYLDLGPINPPAGMEEIPVHASEQQKVRIARKVLSNIKQISRINAILSARVPILKFIHRPTGIHCDISFKNRLSVKNTEYIRLCLDTDPRVRPVLVAVRYWAKLYDLAGGGGGMKMSSYALTMLVINYLQSLDNPILHSVLELQSVPGLQPDIINGWNSNFCTDLSQLESLAVNTQTSLELLAGFFKFISSLELGSVVLCPLLGKVLPRSEVSSSYPDSISTSTFLSEKQGLQLDKPLCLQDPFELSHNVCKNLPEKAVRRFVIFSTETAKLVEKCLSVDQRPSGGLCSLLKIEIPEIEEEKLSNIDNWLPQLSEEKAALFQHNIRVKISDKYLEWFRKENPGSEESFLIACVEKLLGVCFGDCLKLDKHDPTPTKEPEQTTKAEEMTEGPRCSGKRSSSEDQPEEYPLKKKRTDLVYREGCSWSVWDMVWVQRKKAAVLIDRTGKSTVDVEAAVTEAVTKDCIRLQEPEAELRLHYLTPRSLDNSLMVIVGLQKLKSRKKSFESIVTWMRSYIPNIVKHLVEEKLQEVDNLKVD